MDAFALGIAVFVGFSAGLGLLLLGALRRARAEGLEGGALLARLAPFLIGDALLVALFVAWLLLG